MTKLQNRLGDVRTGSALLRNISSWSGWLAVVVVVGRIRPGGTEVSQLAS